MNFGHVFLAHLVLHGNQSHSANAWRFSIFLKESEGQCLSLLLSHCKSSEKGPNRHGHIDPNNSWYPRTL